MQIIVAGPGNNILLPYAVDGANQFHSRKILTVELGKHCLQLRTVKKSEKRRFDDIIIVMTKRNFIAAAVSGGAVKISPAHAGTEVAGRMIRMLRRCEDLRFENFDGKIQPRSILFYLFSVLLRIAGSITR